MHYAVDPKYNPGAPTYEGYQPLTSSTIKEERVGDSGRKYANEEEEEEEEEKEESQFLPFDGSRKIDPRLGENVVETKKAKEKEEGSQFLPSDGSRKTNPRNGENAEEIKKADKKGEESQLNDSIKKNLGLERMQRRLRKLKRKRKSFNLMILENHALGLRECRGN